MQRLLSIAVAGSYLLTNPLTQVMYAVAFAVYHLWRKKYSILLSESESESEI
jgi:hypothetical protein